MAGLVPATHETASAVALHVVREAPHGVDGRDKPGHDVLEME